MSYTPLDTEDNASEKSDFVEVSDEPTTLEPLAASFPEPETTKVLFDAQHEKQDGEEIPSPNPVHESPVNYVLYVQTDDHWVGKCYEVAGTLGEDLESTAAKARGYFSHLNNVPGNRIHLCIPTDHVSDAMHGWVRLNDDSLAAEAKAGRLKQIAVLVYWTAAEREAAHKKKQEDREEMKKLCDTILRASGIAFITCAIIWLSYTFVELFASKGQNGQVATVTSTDGTDTTLVSTFGTVLASDILVDNNGNPVMVAYRYYPEDSSNEETEAVLGYLGKTRNATVQLLQHYVPFIAEYSSDEISFKLPPTPEAIHPKHPAWLGLSDDVWTAKVATDPPAMLGITVAYHGPSGWLITLDVFFWVFALIGLLAVLVAVVAGIAITPEHMAAYKAFEASNKKTSPV